jgi:hypothetical protein
MLVVVAMAAIVMASMRMSVPEDRTLKGLLPLLGFALVGVWAAMLRGWSIIAGGAGGGVLGGFIQVATQLFYYHLLHYDWFANVIYLGPETCLVLDSLAGLIVGVLLGSVVKLSLWLGAIARSN